MTPLRELTIEALFEEERRLVGIESPTQDPRLPNGMTDNAEQRLLRGCSEESERHAGRGCIGDSSLGRASPEQTGLGILELRHLDAVQPSWHT